MGNARKKRLMWTLRWGIILGLYVAFWHINWVKWTLMITVPIGLYCLHMVLFGLEEGNQSPQE
jgi:hypothetical protein